MPCVGPFSTDRRPEAIRAWTIREVVANGESPVVTALLRTSGREEQEWRLRRVRDRSGWRLVDAQLDDTGP